jgi:hypothetical protein
MQTDDIAAWLTAIWDEQEKLVGNEVDVLAEFFPASKGYSWKYRWSRLIWHDGVGPSTSTMPGAPSPTEMLARIAADREILALHDLAPDHLTGKPHWCRLDLETQPCRTLRALASAYATRPGYQEAWRPERLR